LRLEKHFIHPECQTESQTANDSILEQGEGKCREIFTGALLEDDWELVGQLLPENNRSTLRYPVASFCFTKQGE